jgi:uncharacterized membrane protein YjjB (DUF3815 family)
MVLVPGPQILNGMADLLGGRIPLGVSRLVFAALVLTAICAGVMLGMAVCGATVPPAPAERTPVLWLIMLSGGVAAACFGGFYSMPLRLLAWPATIAALVGAGRWAVMSLMDQGPAMGAAAGGLIGGLLALPFARRHHLPFAGVGFSSVVALIPGALILRMAGGLWALQTASPSQVSSLLEASVTDGSNAVLIVVAMIIGIVAPRYLYDAWGRP